MVRAKPRPVRAPHFSAGERVTLRPIGPRDAAVLQAYVRGLSPESRYDRFFGALYELPPTELDRVTHLDRKNELALLAETRVDGAPSVIGEARYAFAPDRLEGEFALSVADHWRGRGLGTLLMADIERRATSLGVRHLFGDVLRSNEPMKALARKHGFGMTDVPRDARLVRIVKDLALSRGAGSSGMATASNLPIAAWSALSSRSGGRSGIGRSKDNYCSSKQAILRSMQSRQRCSHGRKRTSDRRVSNR
jgi:GNAT superfamily N-acetyltransferase